NLRVEVVEQVEKLLDDKLKLGIVSRHLHCPYELNLIRYVFMLLGMCASNLESSSKDKGVLSWLLIYYGSHDPKSCPQV
uniref:Uncharacterized protein n=1 Tax=Cucumis melo TaxID=3656 RepID=A0A9I9EB25_CUCME